MPNEEDPSLRDMSLEQSDKIKRDIANLELQDQVRRLTNQIAQEKAAIGEPPCFKGSLDPNHYLKCIQTLEDYFEAKGYSNEESFIIAIEKLQGPTYSWFRNLRRERALQSKPIVMNWRMFKSYMNVRLYRDILLEEELLKEKCLFVQ